MITANFYILNTLTSIFSTKYTKLIQNFYVYLLKTVFHRIYMSFGRFHPITPFSFLLQEQTILRLNRNFIFRILFGNCEQDFYFEKCVRIGIVFIRLLNTIVYYYENT